jgi:hypothetical protein
MNIFFKKKSYIINIITIKKKKPLTTFITVFFSHQKVKNSLHSWNEIYFFTWNIGLELIKI